MQYKLKLKNTDEGCQVVDHKIEWLIWKHCVPCTGTRVDGSLPRRAHTLTWLRIIDTRDSWVILINPTRLSESQISEIRDSECLVGLNVW
jgi:hypothetical protein